MKKLSVAHNLAILSIALLPFNSVFAETISTSSSQLLNQSAVAENVHLTVHKDPNCGCCKAWIKQLPSTFTTTVHNTQNINSIKDTLDIPNRYRSCHTAISKTGFIFEGHIPNAAIQSFLANPPVSALGLAVPGMPIGSPGMEVGNKTMRYPIYQLNKDGTHTVYAHAIGAKVELQ